MYIVSYTSCSKVEKIFFFFGDLLLSPFSSLLHVNITEVPKIRISCLFHTEQSLLSVMLD